MMISRRLEHNKHFIRLLKPYQVGDKINFIFPLADGDLHEYLYDRKSWKHQFTQRASPFKNSIWEQMVGLLAALGEYQLLKDDPIERWYHSDLKPSNILIFEGEILVITDFGQAYIGNKTNPEDTSSAGQRQGSEAYAPPESHLGTTMDTKSDVWSMGCILLEVLVYVVQGPEGVEELYEARNIGHGVIHYCYWDVHNQKYVINPGAVKIVGKLLGDFATDKFVLDVWDIILSMLQVDPRQRSTSGEACEALKMAINLNDPAAARTENAREELQSIKSAPCKEYTEAQDSVTRLADNGTSKAITPSEHSHVSGPTSLRRLAEDPFKRYPDERRVIRKR
jgi:serine/threonine protein kinase